MRPEAGAATAGKEAISEQDKPTQRRDKGPRRTAMNELRGRQEKTKRAAAKRSGKPNCREKSSAAMKGRTYTLRDGGTESRMGADGQRMAV